MKSFSDVFRLLSVSLLIFHSPSSSSTNLSIEKWFPKEFFFPPRRIHHQRRKIYQGFSCISLFQDGGTEACYRTILRFESIQRSHAGEWLLLVRSPEGIADASVLLNVTRASGYSHAHIRSPSLTILLLCMILGFLSSPIKLQRMKNYI